MKRKISLSAAIIVTIAAAFAAFAATYFIMRQYYIRPTVYDEAKTLVKSWFIGDCDDASLEDGAIAGMVDGLEDRWSYYMTAEELAAYNLNSANSYEGIGVGFAEVDGEIVALYVYDVSPAAEAGVEPGMVLVSVNGTAVSGKSVDDVKNIINACGGEEFPAVFRLEDGSERELRLAVGAVETEPVTYEMLEGNIGAVYVANFEQRSASGIKYACESLVNEGVEGIIFDMRFNPGGQIPELVEALDYIMPEGVVFSWKWKGGELQNEMSEADCLEIPMAVLVNKASYSAAEYFAALLQESGKAVVVGEKTSGKGRAQSTMLLSNGGAIHISSMEYFLPSGKSLADTGVTPDVELALSDEDVADLYYGALLPEDDEQLMAAVAALSRQIAPAD